MFNRGALFFISMVCFIFLSEQFVEASEQALAKGLKERAEEAAKSPAHLDQVKQKALSGDWDSQFLLAHMYQFGVGVSQNYVETFYWDSMGAEGGFPDSQGQLGLLYYLGDGVKKDNVQAMKWLILACSASEVFHKRYVEWKDMVEKELTENELSEAKNLVAAWIKARAAS